MVLLSIGFTPGKCDIYGKLKELTSHFKYEGINIGLVESDSGGLHFIKCMIDDDESRDYGLFDIEKSFNVYAANIIYQVIMDCYDIDTVNRILQNNYYLKQEEIDEVTKKCRGILKGDAQGSEDYIFYIERKNRIVQKILEYMDESNEIILEGFLRFRLKDSNSELEEMVDRKIEEYLVEREYNEFIKLLKYFVEIQESRMDTVNIVVSADGNYFMYDDNCNEITEELLKDLTSQCVSGEINYDDLLISALITVSPKVIVIHNISYIKNKDIIETIKNVFVDRVKLCPGCELCVSKSPVHRV